MRAAEIQHIITGLINGIGKNDLINLSPGKVITAFIKEVQGNHCILVSEGKEFSARLETDLPAGQNLKLLVEGEKNGKTVLKLLSNNVDDNELPLKNIVTRLGLSENNMNLKLVGEMIKQQMPLTLTSTARLTGFINGLNIPEHEIWIPVFMENNGIKLTQQNYTGVTGLLTDIQFINNDLSKLSAELQSLINTTQSGSGLVETTQKVVNILTQLELNPDQGSDTLAAKLELAVRLFSETKTSQAAPTAHDINIAKDPKAVGELGPMLDKLALNLKEYNSGGHKEIIKLIQTVTEKIEFVRNFNIQTEAGRENMMVFYSTVQFEDRYEPLRLAVKYRDGKEKSNNFSICKLEIKLNTPGLGRVKCEVQLAHKNLTLQFTATSEPAGKALDAFAGVLAKRLVQMAYIVDYLPSKVETEPEDELIPDRGADMQGFFQLNLTV